MSRLPVRVLPVCFACLFLAGSLRSQTIQDNGVRPSLPLVPMSVRFRFVPQYFSQWIDDDLRYSRIEALVDNEAKRPWYEVIFTERTTGVRVFYSNAAKTVMMLKQTGASAYTVDIGFTAIKKTDLPPIYVIRFRDNYGQDINWQFIESSRVIHPETPLLPRPNRLGVVLIYASRRAAAAAGTSLTIGKATSIATGKPNPYEPFYAMGLAVAEIAAGTQPWTVVSCPAAFEREEKWVLSTPDGRRRLLVIDGISDGQALIDQVDEDDPDFTSAQLDVQLLNIGFALRSIRLTNQAAILRISFEPSLPLPVGGSTDATEAHFSVEEGEQSVIAAGTVSVQRSLDAEHIVWHFSIPDWAKPNRYETGVNIMPDVHLGQSVAAWGHCRSESTHVP